MKKDKSKRWFPITPDSTFKSTWDFIGMFFILYLAIVIPYRFCFKARAFGNFKFFEVFIDIFFIVDLGLNCVTGYYKRGNLVMKRGPIFRHYLRTWFIIDFISTLPISWFIPETNIDFWPDDDFDETAEIASGSFFFDKVPLSLI